MRPAFRPLSRRRRLFVRRDPTIHLAACIKFLSCIVKLLAFPFPFFWGGGNMVEFIVILNSFVFFILLVGVLSCLLCPFSCSWKCNKPGHLAEDCLVAQADSQGLKSHSACRQVVVCNYCISLFSSSCSSSFLLSFHCDICSSFY